MGAIQFKKINKVYPNGFHAIHDFDLDIADGEFIVFVGPSGCGKSTVLRMLAGLEKISGGDLLLDGKRINEKPPVERDIAMVFQDYALYGNMSVYDNVGMSLRVRHAKQTDIYDKVMQTSEIVDILPYLKRLPGQLSGGQKQRVSLGRAIVREPKVFLMDEPLSNLDAKLRNSTRVELIQLQRKLRITTVYVTHDQMEAMTMADRMVVMKDGVIQQVGTTMEIYNEPNNMFVAGFIGTPPINFIEGAIAEDVFVFENYRMPLDQITAAALARYEGKKITIGIRPETMSVSSQGGSGALEGKLDSSEYLGNYYLLHILLGNHNITCRTEHAPVKTGETLFVRMDMKKVYFFDPDTTVMVFHAKEENKHE